MGNTEIKEAEFYPVHGAIIVSHKNIEAKYTVYVIQVTTPLGKWIAQRRYSDFKRLHDELVKRFPTHQFPALPERKIFGNLDPEFIQERKRKLNDYLTFLITTSSEHIMSSPEMLTFFDAFNPTFILKNDEPSTNEIEIRTRSSTNSDLAKLSSVGSSPMTLVPTPSSYQTPQPSFNPQCCSELEYTQLYSWLDSISLTMYIHSFLNNGFTLDLLKYYGITDSQLNSMQIIDPAHRAKIQLEVNAMRNEDESKFCVICFEGYKDTLLAPCGHVCCCMECATMLEGKKEPCPVCRKAISNVYKASGV